ncbi:hypothetical protein XB05_04205 [Xanthomonas arboricola]|nr:hypothetical protein XB05_04205 [Xanthomonas arboricola]
MPTNTKFNIATWHIRLHFIANIFWRNFIDQEFLTSATNKEYPTILSLHTKQRMPFAIQFPKQINHTTLIQTI